MSKTNLIVEMPHDLWVSLELFVITNKIKRSFKLYQSFFWLTVLKKLAPFFKGCFLWRGTAGQKNKQAQSDPLINKLICRFFGGLHGHWW